MKKYLLLFLAVSLAGFFTACTSTRKTEKLTVASRTADCVGVAPMKCLLIKRDGLPQWEYWYGGIEGFEYEPGYEYIIRVIPETDANPPADRSSFRYIWVETLSKERKESTGLPQ